MILIKRGACPASLNKPDGDFNESDYKKEDVKDSLLRMQHGKCCYCERSINKLHTREREVEHYLPQSAFKNGSGHIQWHLANKWENLLYACASCNGAKSGKYPINRTTGVTIIINPSGDDLDPEDHIDFVLDDVVPGYKEKGGSTVGKLTIKELQLDTRIDLVKDFRKLKLELENIFIDLVGSIENDDDVETESLKKSLEEKMSAHKPYAGYVRCFIKERLQMLNDRDLPKLEQRHNKTLHKMSIHFPKGFEVRN